MSINPKKTLDKAMLQVSGMQECLPDAKNAPVHPSTIQKIAQTVMSTKMHQQNLKAQLHETTQFLYEQVQQLEENMTRNVNYFMGVWGKSDQRLEKIGKKVILTSRRKSSHLVSKANVLSEKSEPEEMQAD